MHRLQRARKQRIYAAIEREHAQTETSYRGSAKARVAPIADLRSPVEVARAINAALHPSTPS